jgi:hypothetical protein
MLSLDEAIQHAQKRAKSRRTACAAEHQQLANWLIELKTLRIKLGLKPDKILREPLSCDDLEHLNIGTMVRFEPGNNVVYGQDFSVRQGIDHTIIFRVEDFRKSDDGGVWLVAPGFGGNPYGNGRIIVYYNQEPLRRN